MPNPSEALNRLAVRWKFWTETFAALRVCPTSPLDVVANDLENGPCAPLRTRLYLAKEDGDDAQADFFPAQAASLGRVRECTKVISRSLTNFEATVDVVR